MQVVCRDLDDMVFLNDEGVMETGRTLGHQYMTTPSVMNAYGDPLHPAHRLVDAEVIGLISFTEEQVEEVSNIFGKYCSSLSFTDCTVIYCAIVTNGVLISNETVFINACMRFRIKTCTAVQYCQQIKMYKTA